MTKTPARTPAPLPPPADLFPHPKDTVHSLFRGWSLGGQQALGVTDGHADPLRLWVDHGFMCPEGWYAVRCRIAGERKQALSMLVEVNLQDLPYTRTYHTVWYTPSPEHAGEVARQIAAYERRIYRSYSHSVMEIYRPYQEEPYTLSAILSGHDPGVCGVPTWPRITVDVQVYQRCGDTPRLVSAVRAPFQFRPRAV